MTGRPVPLRTPRLHLLPARLADVDELWQLWTDADVRRYLFDDGVISRERAAQIVADALRHGARGLGLWTIRKTAAGKIVGCVGLLPPSEPRGEHRLGGIAEIVIALSPAMQRRGHAIESLNEVMRYAFEDIRLDLVTAAVDVPNEHSRQLLERLGFIWLSESTGPRYELRNYVLTRDYYDYLARRMVARFA